LGSNGAVLGISVFTASSSQILKRRAQLAGLNINGHFLSASKIELIKTNTSLVGNWFEGSYSI